MCSMTRLDGCLRDPARSIDMFQDVVIQQDYWNSNPTGIEPNR